MSDSINQNDNKFTEYLKTIYNKINTILITNIISIVMLELVVVILVQKVFNNWIITIFLTLLFVVILGKGFKKEKKLLNKINTKYPDYK
ncbi:hypothetical protein KKB10_04975 [Patescibacteria group bacterium]|nr:hypothetical protein [Patescibacteria group bacterium]MBU1952298.1 hypothetical protein [Patescibacteria group bacterium]